MSLLDFTLPASDPNNPNAIIPPDAIKQRRLLAAALMKQGGDASPIRSPWQGAARLAQTLQGVVEDYSADRDQRAGERSAREQMAALLSGDTPSAAPAAAPAPASAPATLDAGTGGMPKYASAISAIESGGQKDPYASLGPETKGDRPYGRYQVMGANVGPWSKAALGRELSPQEFLSDPQAQDAIFNHRFGQYVDKYGPEGAARAWFAGEGGMNSPGRRDVLGTSVADYGRKFNASLGDQPQATPIGDQPEATPAAMAPAPAPAAATAGPRRFDPAKLAAVLSNPYATPAQQQIASALLKQKFERTDIEKKLDAAGVTDPAERSRIIKNDIEGSENWDLKTITNQDGSTTPVKVNKNTGEITPVELPKSEASAAIEQGVTGDEFLKTLDPRARDIIKKVANYEIDPRTLSIKGGHREDILSKVARYDPDYDQANYASRAAALKEFNSGGPNAPASAITSGNTYIQHLKTLSDASQRIGGTNNAWILNKPINWLNANVEELKNNPDLVEYKKALDRVVEEGTKFYRGVGGNESDIQRTIAALTPGQSPEARNRAIATEAELINGKVNALQSRFQTALGASAWKKAIERTGPDFPIIQKKSADALDAIRARNRGQTPKETKPERTTKSINGKNYYQENGQWYEE